MDLNLDENNSDDSCDEDYVPGKNSDEEAASEASDDGVASDSSDDDENDAGSDRKHKLNRKRTVKSCGKSIKRKSRIKLGTEDSETNGNKSEDETNENGATLETSAEIEAKEKERANMLWKDFMNDSEIKPRSKPIVTAANNSSNSNNEKLVVTKEFKFAGEIVRVTEELDPQSKKLKLMEPESNKTEVKNASVIRSPVCSNNVKKPEGLNSVLSKISGMKKISTLEKSRLDWNVFKEDEGITDELKSFNRGKKGYLENQAFLERADQRQFEIEKDFRTNRNKR